MSSRILPSGSGGTGVTLPGSPNAPTRTGGGQGASGVRRPSGAGADDGQPAETKLISPGATIDFGTVKLNGAITPEMKAIAGAWLEGSQPLGSATAGLDALLATDGNAQIHAVREYYRQYAQEIAVEWLIENGNPAPSDEEIQSTIAMLYESIDAQILLALDAAQANGPLGQGTPGLVYQGIDLRKAKFNPQALEQLGADLSPQSIAAMTDLKCSEMVEALIAGDGGGSAELNAKRASLPPAEKGAFDRGLLISLGVTSLVASTDLDYAKDLGVKPKGGGWGDMPPEYQGDVMMMIAWIFAKRDQELVEAIGHEMKTYSAIAQEKADSDDDKLREDKQSELTSVDLRLKMFTGLWETNSATGASLMGSCVNARKAVWQ